MNQSPLFRKILAFVVMALLLSLPLVSLTANSVFISVDAANPEVSLTANDVGNTENCPLRSGSELSFNGELIPAERLILPGDPLQSSAISALAVPSLKDLISEIFIPPRIAS